jgi:murein L,D-transpeptidase YcbB/YkuD
MKTTVSIVGKKTILFELTFHFLTRALRQLATVIIKYSYFFFSVVIFVSCQKNLTQTEPSPNEITQSSQPAVVAEEKFISIDTIHYSIANNSLLTQQDSALNNRLMTKVMRFYTANHLHTKWLEETKPNPLYFALLDQLKGASTQGLRTSDYDADKIEERVYLLYRSKYPETKEIIDLDVHLTEMFFLFATHLGHGRIMNIGNSKNIWVRETKRDTHADVTLLLNAKNADQLKETLIKLQPAHPQYAKLQHALTVYVSLESYATKIPAITSVEKIKPGDRHAAIPFIKRKLSLMDMSYEATKDTTTNDSLVYDQKLMVAVKSFQERHGLEADGIIGGSTLKFLNRSFKESADLIALNMERLRWLPENYEAQHITVNIPEYKLRIYENQKQTLEMKVIVGALHSATPVFHDTLEHVVFSPTWTVPPSIMKTEIFPRLKKNPGYYSQRDFTFYKNGVEIDPSLERLDSVFNVNQYRVVQKPGAYNSLGLVKFAMPNTMNIYLHDTPDHSLFSKNFRALSHGCIRLDDPARFAAYLLQEEKAWSLPSIQKAMKSSKPAKVVLKKRYAVHLEYQTAWVDDKGVVNFREDIYGHDKRQLQQLKPEKKVVTLATL